MAKFLKFTTSTVAGAAMLMAAAAPYALEVSAGASDTQNVYNSLLTQVDARLAQFQSSLGTQVTNLQSQLSQEIASRIALTDILTADVTTLDTRADNLETRANTLQTSLNNLTTRVTNSEGAIGTLRTEMNAAKTDIVNLRNSITALATRTTGLEGRMTGVENRTGSLESRTAGLETRMGNIEWYMHSDVRPRMASAEARLANVENFANAIWSHVNALADCTSGYGGRAACAGTIPSVVIDNFNIGRNEDSGALLNGTTLVDTSGYGSTTNRIYTYRSDVRIATYPYCAVIGGQGLSWKFYRVVKGSTFWEVEIEEWTHSTADRSSGSLRVSCMRLA